MRVGVVGVGRVAEIGYLPALRTLATAELAGVADVREERCARVAPGVPAFPDAAALVASGGVELVVVTTPPDAHLEAARAAADAGCATLVEKPPAAELADALALASLAPAPWIGLNRRFDPAVERLRRRAAELRPPLALTLAMSSRPREWGPVVAPPGPLLDLASHLVDLASWLTERAVRRVRARRIDELGASLELDLGAAGATVEVSHAASWRESVVVRGAAGRRAALTRGGLLRRLAVRLGGREGPLVPTLRAQLAAACAALRGGAADPRLASAADGVVLMRALAAAEASARRGGEWVEVEAAEVASCSR